MMVLWVVLGLLVIVGLWMIGVYNGLINLKNRTDEANSDIDVQTKLRYDAIPNLVETVKGYAKHEKSVFTEVTRARTEAMQAKDIHDKAEKENMLTQTLKSLFAVAENYPELKADQNFGKLQDTIYEIEEKIENSRKFYNANVRDFNIKIEVFPNNVIANMLGFKRRELFEAASAEKEAVKVDFNK